MKFTWPTFPWGKNTDTTDTQVPAPSTASISEADLQRLAQLLQQPRTSAWRTFFIGVFSGMGYFIGLTVGIAILVWILKEFVHFPVVGEYVERVLSIIDNYTPPIKPQS